MQYEWRNIRTGELRLTDSATVPPADGWRRVYSVHFLGVKGAGGSPGGYVRHVPKG